jgi:hypothetical protein
MTSSLNQKTNKAADGYLCAEKLLFRTILTRLGAKREKRKKRNAKRSGGEHKRST